MSDYAGADFYDIVVVEPGATPNAIFNVASKFNRLGLTPGRWRKMLKELPQPVCEHVPAAQAEALKMEMESFGAVVELRPSNAG
jgi:hypothetical protein